MRFKLRSKASATIQEFPPAVTPSRQTSDKRSDRDDAARRLALTAARVADETRASDVRVLDLRGLTEVFDYFVLATGSSRRQLHAIADEIEKVVKAELHDRKRGSEGYEEGRWIVLDYGDVMVHLFDAEAREYWDIEQLWSGAKAVPLPAGAAR